MHLIHVEKQIIVVLFSWGVLDDNYMLILLQNHVLKISEL